VIIIAIDPGVHRCACAGFDDDGTLTEAWFETARTFKRGEELPTTPRYSAAVGVDVIIVEQPQVDRRTRTAVPEVVALSWHGALLAGEFAGREAAPVVAVTPSEWKGSEPKPQHHARLWEILSAEERRVLGGVATQRAILAARQKGALTRWSKPGAAYYPRAFVMHNLLDAAALGAWYTGRLERR
jgi:hypothetical protein